MRLATGGRWALEGRAEAGWGHGPATVREATPRYEDEGSVREARGAVPVDADAWWSVSLAVPVRDGSRGAPLVLLRMRRLGAPVAGASRDLAVELLVPAAEVDAIATLVAGVVAQARRDGVLPGVHDAGGEARDASR